MSRLATISTCFGGRYRVSPASGVRRVPRLTAHWGLLYPRRLRWRLRCQLPRWQLCLLSGLPHFPLKLRAWEIHAWRTGHVKSSLMAKEADGIRPLRPTSERTDFQSVESLQCLSGLSSVKRPLSAQSACREQSVGSAWCMRSTWALRCLCNIQSL